MSIGRFRRPTFFRGICFNMLGKCNFVFISIKLLTEPTLRVGNFFLILKKYIFIRSFGGKLFLCIFPCSKERRPVCISRRSRVSCKAGSQVWLRLASFLLQFTRKSTASNFRVKTSLWTRGTVSDETLHTHDKDAGDISGKRWKNQAERCGWSITRRVGGIT